MPTPDRRRRAEFSRDWFSPYRQRGRHVTGGASSTATRSIARPRSPEQCHYQEARAICAPGCYLQAHRHRSATTGAAAQSAKAMAPVLGLNRRRRRHGDHGISGNPAASCAIRFGSEARISRLRSALAPPHSAISPSERPQPVQWLGLRTKNNSRCQLMVDLRLKAFRRQIQKELTFTFWQSLGR